MIRGLLFGFLFDDSSADRPYMKCFTAGQFAEKTPNEK